MTTHAPTPAPGAGTAAAALPPVLFVNLSRTWGGGETWHFTMARALHRRGRRVALLVYPEGPLHAAAREAGLDCWPLPLRAVHLLHPRRMAHLWRGLRQRRPGAVILNAAHELKVVGLVAKVAGVPAIVYRRGIPRAPRRTRLNAWYLRRVAGGIIANSQATLDAVRAVFPTAATPARSAVIHNGLDPAEWPEPTGPRGTGSFAVVARLTEEKGVDRAIAALPAIRAQVPDAHLVVLGDGPLREALQEQAEALGVHGAVSFLGHTAEVAHHLAACDLLVLPSRWEGFGYVLLEAMIMALPAVAFDLPAAREIVDDGVTGRLVPEGDIEALAQAVATLLAEPETARAMGRAGRERALREFTLERAADRLEAFLERMGAGTLRQA